MSAIKDRKFLDHLHGSGYMDKIDNLLTLGQVCDCHSGISSLNPGTAVFNYSVHGSTPTGLTYKETST